MHFRFQNIAGSISTLVFILLFVFAGIFAGMFALRPAVAEAAASISLSPASGTYHVGETITVFATVAGSVPLNAISGSILFPPDQFSIVSVSKSSSILNFWVTEPAFSAGSGVVRFEGVVLGGFSGQSGTVVAINVRPLKEGTASARFQNAQVLANDGQGTDITGPTAGATYTIIPPAPKSQPPTPVEQPQPTETSQPAPTLAAPHIMLGNKYGSMSINGTSDYPTSQVLITFIGPDGSKIFLIDQTNEGGEFSVLVPKTLKYGRYTVTAVIIKSDKTSTQPSNTLRIQVGTIFSDLAWWDWLAIILLLLAIIYLVARLYFHFGRKATNVERRIYDAERTTDKVFDKLHAEVRNIEKNRLNTADKRAVSDLEKDLDAAERTIDKKIEDIDVGE